MKKLARKSNGLKDILDSDDELPTDYIEIPCVPAYQDHNRFGYIEEQKNIKNELLKHKTGESSDGKIENTNHQQLKNEGTVLLNGYLNKKDLLCIQSLEPKANDKTLLWFFHFLILKELQSNYQFLTTCLVPNYDYYD